MSVTLKVLGQVNPAAATLTTLYTVPANTSAVCSSLVICNQDGKDLSVRVAVRPAGATIAPKHYLLYDVNIPKQSTQTYVLGLSLAATDVVSVQCDDTTASFNLFGTEVT